jgi:peptidoglycan/LPS O-acetylase OafA/YrhL
MNTRISLYLDFARFTAALAVFLHHLLQEQYLGFDVRVPGRTAVIVFFVLSGFVIAFVADGRERNWRTYAVSRCARIYSVAVPAIALTAVLYVIGRNLFPSDYPAYDNVLARLAASLLFLNHLWNLTIEALNNGPYWSLGYEVWYYAIFGIAFFSRGRLRIALTVVALLVAGPRIILLMPIWLTGAAAYHFAKHARITAHRQVWIFVIAGCLIAQATLWGNPMSPIVSFFERCLEDGYLRVAGMRLFIGGDARFVADYYLGFLVALTIVSSPSVLGWIEQTPRIAKFVRTCASYTFSLYLYHVPLLIFLACLLFPGQPSITKAGVLFVAVIGIVVILGRWTEHEKASWARLFERALTWARPRSLAKS